MSNPYVHPSESGPKVRLLPVLLVGFAMLLLFWFATKWLFYSQPELTDEEAVRSLERAEILQKVNEQAGADLNQYAWKDRAAGVFQIPVRRAMELEVLTLNINRDIRPAYPIDPISEPLPPMPPVEASPEEAAHDAVTSEEATAAEVQPPAPEQTETPATD